MVALAQAHAGAEVAAPRLVVAQDHVHTEFREFADRRVGAEAPVGHEGVARPQVPEEPAREPALAVVVVPPGHRQPGPAAQVEEPDELHEREAAAALLAARLRILALVLRGVGKHDGGAVDEEDPAPGSRLRGGEPSGHEVEDTQEQSHRQAQAGLAVGARVARGKRESRRGEESLDAGEGLAAGGTGIENLPEEGPEGDHGREGPVPAVEAGRRLEIKDEGGHEGPEELPELGEAELVSLAPGALDHCKLADGRTPEEMPGHAMEKRGLGSHADTNITT